MVPRRRTCFFDLTAPSFFLFANRPWQARSLCICYVKKKQNLGSGIVFLVSKTPLDSRARRRRPRRSRLSGTLLGILLPPPRPSAPPFSLDGGRSTFSRGARPSRSFLTRCCGVHRSAGMVSSHRSGGCGSGTPLTRGQTDKALPLCQAAAAAQAQDKPHHSTHAPYEAVPSVRGLTII